MALLHDLRLALRLLRKTPTISLVAVATLAFGIGVTTAAYAIVRAVILEPVPVPDGNRLAFLTRLEADPPEGDVSLPDGEDLRAETTSFEAIGLFIPGWSFDLGGDGGPERIRGTVAEARLFEVLRPRPVVGRLYGAADEAAGADPVAVISVSLWQRHFGGARDAVGSTLRLSGKPFTVVGVVPDHTDVFESGTELWVPPASETPWALGNRGTNNFEALARLRPDVDFVTAGRELTAVSRRLAEAYPDTNRSKVVTVVPLVEALVGDAGPVLLALFAAVASVLLVTCLNLASLLLARSITRRRELATRRALGASAGRLARQLVVEGLVLAALGGASGILLAFWARDLVLALAPAAIPRADGTVIDAGVVGFGVALAAVTGILLGSIPTISAVRRPPAGRLRGRGHSETAGARRLLGGLVVAEVAIACTLLVGGSLLVRSLERLRAVDLGFETGGVLLAEIVLPEARYGERDAQTRAFSGILAAVARVPGVDAVSTVIGAPLTPAGGVGSRFEIGDRPPAPPAERSGAQVRPVAGEHFRVLRQRVVEGRVFEAGDDLDAEPVAVINERLARRHWPDASPIGARVRLDGWGDDQPWRTVVGVVADIKGTTLAAPDNVAIYIPYEQRVVGWQRFGTLAVRSRSDPSSIVGAVRAAVARVDPDLPLADVETLTVRHADALASDRLLTLGAGLFALVALGLAVLGVYGTLAFAVEQRRVELGVRQALGADRRDLVRAVVGDGLRLAAIGLAVGTASSLALGRVFASLLFEVSPRDPASFVVAALVIGASAAAASYWPGRRAAGVDPIEALRET